MEAVGIDLTACQPTALLRLHRARKSGRKDCGQGWLTPCITEKRKASQRWKLLYEPLSGHCLGEEVYCAEDMQKKGR